MTASSHKTRLGIMYNQENDCNSCDVATGVGVRMWGNDRSAANYVDCCSNLGKKTKDAKAMILIGYMP